MEQIETIEHPAEAINEVNRWRSAITALEAKGAALAQRRESLERERRVLLGERAGGNGTVEERLQELKTELTENERESEEVRLALPEAGRRLVEAKQQAKDAAIVALTAMLSALQKERDRLIAKARSGDPAALQQGYIAHRQWFGLTTDLHTLTRNGQFSAYWNLAPFGADLEYQISHVHMRAKQGMIPIPTPWKALLAISQEQ